MAVPNFATPATKYVSNPIIARAALTSWYSNQLFDFQAMVDPADATQLLIFCSGLTVTTNVISIGLFTAPVSTPYSWTLIGQVLQGSGSGFDSAGVRLGSVIYDSGTFYLFYTGYATSYTANYYQGTIGVATSADHLTFGSRTQIVTASGNGRNDGSGLDCFAAIKKPDNAWAAVYAYYTDASNGLPGFRAATASSPTGTWTKAGSGDIYGGDAPGTKFYEFHQLLYVAPTYYLLYEQGGSVASLIPYQCYAASSSDPTTTFTALNSGTPLIPVGAGGAWDQYHTATPGVLTAGNGNPTTVGGNFLGYYCGAGDALEPYYDNKWPPAMVTFAAVNGMFSTVFAGVVR